VSDENGELRIKVARLEEMVKAADKALTVATEMRHFVWGLMLNLLISLVGLIIGVMALYRK
jgi:hypothetical protein